MRASCRSTLTHRQPSPVVVELMTLAVPTLIRVPLVRSQRGPTNRINALQRFRATNQPSQGPNGVHTLGGGLQPCASRSEGNCLAGHAELLRATHHSGALPTGDSSIRTTSNGESREGADETFRNRRSAGYLFGRTSGDVRKFLVGTEAC